MTKGDFKCATCGRTFSMAAHLARHTSSMHRRPGRPKGWRKNKNVPGKRLGRPPMTSRTAAAGEFGDDGSRVLSEMAAYRDALLLQRSTIDRRLEGLQSAMSAMGTDSPTYTGGSISTGKRRGRPPGSGRKVGIAKSKGGGRRGRPGSLKQMIVQVLRQRGSPHSPTQIAESVVKAGYKTSSENLVKSVSNTLPQLPEVRKVGRGLYQA